MWIKSAGKLSDGEVDIYNSITLEYSDLRFATIEYSLLATLDDIVTITGCKGCIHVPDQLTRQQK
ncbi:hypothetical protein PsorP6_008536 [Peronosclerospora sorghi]|uniref:Uncharacterized protein n=1 Tax=Peronosclerospora sorghi TaxID=230839 RepID=A0ACC0W9U2_9STRA|nr:hypothetical protein PsorP6_008536 [Peronosclerospora sorghi]